MVLLIRILLSFDTSGHEGLPHLIPFRHFLAYRQKSFAISLSVPHSANLSSFCWSASIPGDNRYSLFQYPRRLFSLASRHHLVSISFPCHIIHMHHLLGL